jgi:hypothetical protein
MCLLLRNFTMWLLLLWYSFKMRAIHQCAETKYWRMDRGGIRGAKWGRQHTHNHVHFEIITQCKSITSNYSVSSTLCQENRRRKLEGNSQPVYRSSK